MHSLSHASQRSHTQKASSSPRYRPSPATSQAILTLHDQRPRPLSNTPRPPPVGQLTCSTGRYVLDVAYRSMARAVTTRGEVLRWFTGVLLDMDLDWPRALKFKYWM